MTPAQLPRIDDGAVLAGTKATPYGWPLASPDPSSGRHPGRDRERDPTNSGLYGFRGLPVEQSFRDDLLTWRLERVKVLQMEGDRGPVHNFVVLVAQQSRHPLRE